MLSPQEQEIAKTLGFEDQVLELVKEALSPEMVIMTTDGFEEDQSGLRTATHSSTISLLEKDRKQYEKIKREYPELESVIEAALAREQPGEQRILLIQFGKEKRDRHQKLVAAIYPYIRLRFQSPNRIAESAHFVDAAMEQALESDSDLEEAIVELKKQFAAQGWDDLNEGRYLGIKFWGVGDSRYETDARVKKLRTPLKKLGYGITEEHREFDQSQQFETREDAEKFLHDTGTRINDHLNCLKVQKARKFIAIYPIHDDDWKDFEKAKILVSQSASANLDDEAVSQKAKLLQHDLQAGFMSPKSAFGPKFKLRPGALVTPIGDRLWSIDLPTRYTAQAYRRLASIIKVSSGSAGLELVRAKQTAGINYSVSNQMVLAKLKDWHEKYGISVSEASSDSMTVRFKKPPNDLTQLCTEFVTFCPDLVDGCEADNANAIKDIAAKLRETNVIEFWWD